jgi:hypothetical protein
MRREPPPNPGLGGELAKFEREPVAVAHGQTRLLQAKSPAKLIL